ncbi:hypothetical protein LCGC14_2521920 [marine sediment metagenome]|uniref:Uncharacterized protein n=1 Tax=marine sediment metagenome TaxID=412755 RepID=A0A0F9AW62_9ZZZZ
MQFEKGDLVKPKGLGRPYGEVRSSLLGEVDVAKLIPLPEDRGEALRLIRWLFERGGDSHD